MHAIETDNLTKQFGDIVAVDGLNMSVEQGEVFGFLGPNGAGKSTTINMLLGFLDPSDGSGTVLGNDIDSASLDVRERIGVLPEGFSPYERLSAREHVEYAGNLKNCDPDVEALLDRVGLDREAWDRRAGDYSTGMCQRLALATALVGDPELLILDEPSSGLDPQGIAGMRELIREEADSGTTVFFSSHHLSEVEAVCNRVAILVEGSLAAQGTLDDLRDGTATDVPLELTVDHVPDGLDTGLAGLDGVRSVTIDGATISADLESQTDKYPVINYVGERTRVTDVIAEETSLESLFERYANGDTSAVDRDEEATDATTAAAEVNA